MKAEDRREEATVRCVPWWRERAERYLPEAVPSPTVSVT